jgi:hypothetical protein
MSLTQIQGAIYSKLTASSAVMALVTGVYDDVPQAAKSEDDGAFPFIVIGDDDYLSWDTDTEVGWQCDFRVHIWSRYRGKKELLDIANAVHNALNRTATSTTGYHVLDINHVSTDSFVEPDGKTRHGILQFKMYFEVI